MSTAADVMVWMSLTPFLDHVDVEISHSTERQNVISALAP